MTVILRPYVAADVPRPTAGESEFDDFGRESSMMVPPPWTLWDGGHLAVEVDGTVIGDVGWHRTGFVREGGLHGAQWRRGAFHDLVAFPVLRSGWQDW